MIESYPLYWPEGRSRAGRRERNPNFKSVTFAGARDGLLAELRRLGAQKIILSTNVPVRGDGLPYANAREPDDPGVAVYFDYKKKPMCFACDKYVVVRQNLRAIALTIEAIRGIERWGSSDMMERAFKGFTALPEQNPQTWRDTLGFSPGTKVTVDEVEAAFRQLVKVHHPDAGGDAELFHRLVIARDNARRDLGAAR